jgi:ABC-2 type transport system ATP-binding protein
MIETRALTRRYGATVAVHSLTFQVRPGRVTGFLGPNGSGKSTTRRLILGLDTPTAGQALVGGRRYRELGQPLRLVGSLLDAGAVHPGRRARDHLAWLAASNSLPGRRVGEVLERTGLGAVAGRRVGTFSLGMKQRLGIAAALLGDPRILLLDEPVNGLDPEGVLWIRTLMRSLAAEGRTVLVSSHLMSEVAVTADHVLVIGRGKLIADTGMAEFLDQTVPGDVLVRSPQNGALADLLRAQGAAVTAEPGGALSVTGMTPETVSQLAAAYGLAVHELTARQASLEQAYLRLTGEAVDYRAAPPAASDFPAAPRSAP